MVQLKTGSFKNLEPGDIQQGILGDCYFLGSLMIMASTNWKLVQNLIVFDGVQKYGFAVFQFFKDGHWQQVIIDTKLPCIEATEPANATETIQETSENKLLESQFTPLYGRCKSNGEFWVQLIEKAYAKLHGNYESIHGGHLGSALVDLTGGISHKMHLDAPEVR